MAPCPRTRRASPSAWSASAPSAFPWRCWKASSGAPGSGRHVHSAAIRGMNKELISSKPCCLMWYDAHNELSWPRAWAQWAATALFMDK
ncbi:hypothetical protein [Leporid alphaherpesvirus 4]|uniref:Uncharacterized protein n=1 Tax=Leporid alphaherpesvirus 4 TaxID=481315 RepID=J9QQU1_9ALPH|nr:hypothetical protein [Leporid alphaherpesvirus 4]AFR32516.1 hypothetical protein [Leporid alphaherpesvirus 4]